jgi:hypothetical protein
MKDYPKSLKGKLRLISEETARMSYPGSMSRGKKSRRVVNQGTKEVLEEYFKEKFPIRQLWLNSKRIARNYDTWHKREIGKLATFLLENKCFGNPTNEQDAVAAKFLNTFMNQLLKYPEFQQLRRCLHLPVDSGALKAICELGESGKSKALGKLSERGLKKSTPPYGITCDQYMTIQCALREYVRELNKRRNLQFKVDSVIDLNSYLWIPS